MRIIIATAAIMVFFGCNNQAGTEQSPGDTTVKNDPVLKKDTLFTAFGNEPFWDLSIIENDKYVFHPMEGSDVVVPWVAPVELDSLTTRYASTDGTNNIVLLVTKKTCSDGMSEEEHGYATDVTVNAAHYSGCGRLGR